MGILRPITLFPFPTKKLQELSNTTKKFLTIEMNMGQMVRDVKLAVNGKVPVEFLGKPTGQWIGVEEITDEIQHQLEGALCN